MTQHIPSHFMNGDESTSQLQATVPKSPSSENNNSLAKQTNAVPQKTQDGTNLKEYNNLMPKTIEELKEIQARGRRLMFRKKYIKRNRLGPPQVRQKTAEELKLEAIQKEKDIKEFSPQIIYSKYYFDDEHEYRHVVLPKNLIKWLPKGLLKPEQWIELGVHQSSGWEHYMIYAPEPHILLFRREKGYIAKHGDHAPQVPPELVEETIRQRREEDERKRQKELSKTTATETTISTIPPHNAAFEQPPTRPRTRSTAALNKH